MIIYTHNGKAIIVNGKAIAMRGTPSLTYKPIVPDNTATYPMYIEGDALQFAVMASDGTYGYYAPSTDSYTVESGMSGTVIERVEYVSFDGSQYVNSAVNLLGSDTVTIDFTNKKSGDNVFGSWHSNNQNVYTMYASSASSYVRYNSALYRNTPIPLNTRLVFKMTPTGDYVDDTRYHTWEEGSFNTGAPCLVGWLDGSGSPKLEGDVYSFAIDGKSALVPVKVGTAYYLFDTAQWCIPTHVGTLTGGSVIEEDIAFPTSIYHEPVMLMMGGNPNQDPDDGGDEE